MMSFSIPKVGEGSPWGTIQHVELLGDGIAFVHTASHGGVRLFGSRYEVFRDLVPEFEPWSGRRNIGWFEEDCDWAAVAVLWQFEFSAKAVETAFAIAKMQAASQDGGPYRRGWRAVLAAAQALSDKLEPEDASERILDQTVGRILDKEA